MQPAEYAFRPGSNPSHEGRTATDRTAAATDPEAQVGAANTARRIAWSGSLGRLGGVIYLVVLVYEDRIGKTKFLDSGGHLFDLLARMRPCIARIRFQFRNFAIDDC